MICRNCGFHNEPGDEFCGSCGKFLEWSGADGQAATGAAAGGTAAASSGPNAGDAGSGQPDSPTTSQPVTPLPPIVPPPGITPNQPIRQARPITHTQPITGTQPMWSGRDPDVICWNCGRRNPGDRTFCLQCGEKLTAGTVAGRNAGAGRGAVAGTAGGGNDGRRTLAIGAGIVAVLLLAGIGVAVFLGGGPGPTATPFAGGLASPSPSTGLAASVEPSASAGATLAPSAGASGLPSPTLDLFSPSPTVPGATPAPTKKPTPTAVPTPEPPQIVRFRRENFTSGTRRLVDCTDPAFDGTIHLVWEIRAATGVTLDIDGEGLYKSYSDPSGSDNVPFGCGEPSHTYTLTTTGGVGNPDSVTRTISPAPPEILGWSLYADVACPGNLTAPIYLSWNIAYATGVELRIDGALYANYPGKEYENAPAGNFDCAKTEQTYTLTTTGGYGDAAEETRVFPRP